MEDTDVTKSKGGKDKLKVEDEDALKDEEFLQLLKTRSTEMAGKGQSKMDILVDRANLVKSALKSLLTERMNANIAMDIPLVKRLDSRISNFEYYFNNCQKDIQANAKYDEPDSGVPFAPPVTPVVPETALR